MEPRVHTNTTFADRQKELREVPYGHHIPHNMELERISISDAVTGERRNWATLRPGDILTAHNRKGGFPGFYLCVSEARIAKVNPPVRSVTVIETQSVQDALDTRDKIIEKNELLEAYKNSHPVVQMAHLAKQYEVV